MVMLRDDALQWMKTSENNQSGVLCDKMIKSYCPKTSDGFG